jgi:hypothetical protein
MSRDVNIDEVAYDQFSVYEADGYTKHSGLLQADFDIILWHNGVVNITQAVTISEIGTSGEYKTEFTPNQIGYWELEVQISYNSTIWHGRYQVGLPDGAALAGQKYREQVTDNFGNAVPYVTVNIYEMGTANLLASKQTDYNGCVEFDLIGALYNPGLVDIEFMGGGIETFKKEVVRITS